MTGGNAGQGQNNQNQGVIIGTVYSQMYEEGRYYRNHELTVSTWYGAFLIAFIAAIVAFKSFNVNLSLEIRILLFLAVIVIGSSSILSVIYSGMRYNEIRRYLNRIEPTIEPALGGNFHPNPMLYNPRQLIILTLATLTIITSIIIFLP